MIMEKIDWNKFKVDGIDYTPEGIEELRQELIGYRADAMNQQAWQPVMVLSHTIAVLAYLIEMIKLQDQQEGWTDTERRLQENPELLAQIKATVNDPSRAVRRERPRRRGDLGEDL